MNKRVLLQSLTLTTFLFIPSAYAQDAKQSSLAITGGATFATDYIFRGFSQTDEEPAVQGSINLAHESGLGFSLWGSNVDFNDGDEASVEIDATGSYTFPIGNTNFTLGGIYYAYPGADSSLDYDYLEVFGGVSQSFDKWGDYGFQAFYSPEFFANTGDAVYTTASAAIPTPIENLKAVGSVGYQWIDDNVKFGAPDYADWSLGVTYQWDKFTGSVKYYDTSVSDSRCSSLCEARAVASIGVSF